MYTSLVGIPEACISMQSNQLIEARGMGDNGLIDWEKLIQWQCLHLRRESIAECWHAKIDINSSIGQVACRPELDQHKGKCGYRIITLCACW